jgi:RHS repeat-associated protein
MVGAGSYTRNFVYNNNPAHSGANNQLLSTTIGANPVNYTYDGHGNMLNLPELPGMAWNYQDQLVAATQQVVSAGTGQTTYYSYDAGGIRTRKVTMSAAATGGTAALVSERLYIGPFEIYRTYDGAGNVNLQRETLHVMDDQSRIATIDNKTIDNTGGDGTVKNTYYPRYQYGNHLGNSAYELDGSGNIISYEEYHPFGTSSYQAMSPNNDVPLKRYRYTGKERDEESGLYYHGARYYAPWLCRWTAADPIGIGDGVNVYSYVHGNPISYSDQTGTTFTVGANEATAGGTGGTKFTTSQQEANKVFLRDVRAGLSQAEGKLFAINAQNQLTFTGDPTKVSGMSGLAQLLVGQINSTKNITVLPAVLGNAGTPQQAAAIDNGSVFTVARNVNNTMTPVPGLIVATSPLQLSGSVAGSTVPSGNDVFVTYMSGPDVAKGGLPFKVSGKTPNISSSQESLFMQGTVTQTLVHELAAHVQGNLNNEPNADSQFGRIYHTPNHGDVTMREFLDTMGFNPPAADTLGPPGSPITSLAPFERSLRLEREALTALKAKLPAGRTLGGTPDRRVADINLIKRALNQLTSQPAPPPQPQQQLPQRQQLQPK